MVGCESGYELLSAHSSQLARAWGTFFSFKPVALQLSGFVRLKSKITFCCSTTKEIKSQNFTTSDS